MKTGNIKAFKALILKYESITIDDLENDTIPNITGFNSVSSCTLCTALIGKPGSEEDDCSACIYYKIDKSMYACMHGPNKITYQEINDLKYTYTHKSLLIKAIRERAKYMRSILTKLKIKQP